VSWQCCGHAGLSMDCHFCRLHAVLRLAVSPGSILTQESVPNVLLVPCNTGCGSRLVGYRFALSEARRATRTTSGTVVTGAPSGCSTSGRSASGPWTHPLPGRARVSSSPSTSSPRHTGSLVGSSIRQTYHRPTCKWARRISSRNRITFGSATDAIRRGYRACGACNP